MPTLADIYSAINTAKRKGTDFIQNPGTNLQQMLSQTQENLAARRARDEAIWNQAHGDPMNPLRVTDPEAFKQEVSNSMDLMSFAPAGMTKVYRGLSQPNNPAQINRVDWYTPDRDLATTYGKHIIEKDLPENHSPFDFGFRSYSTEVKLNNMVDRIKDGILDSYKNGKITENKAKSLFKKVNAINTGSEYKPAAQWITDDERLTNLLKESGYDTISHVQDGIQTYGFINK